jgi:alkylation response protein AidB-like acyl-CoA dehydrogenase
MSVSPLNASERRELVEVTADFARRRLTPAARTLDDGDGATFDECWAGVRELGLGRALLPESLGGAGLATSDLAAPLEEVARADGGIALSVLLGNAALLALPPESAAIVLDSERWAAVVVPDRPAVGARALRIGTHAGQPTLNGHIRMALGALGADGIVVLGNAGAGGAYVVARDATGCAMQPTTAQMGLRAARAADIEFADTPVQAVTPAPQVSTLILWGVAAIARGIARRAYEIASTYAETRLQGGVPIIEHGAVRSMLASMVARLQDGRVPASGAPGVGDHAGALAAKVRATDDALEIAIDAVQVLGGSGYMREAGVEKLMRDARYCQLYPEPNWVARDRLLDLDRP